MGQQSAMMSGGPNVATGQTAGGGPGMLSPQQQPPGTPNMMNSPEMFFELTQTGKEAEGGFDYMVLICVCVGSMWRWTLLLTRMLGVRSESESSGAFRPLYYIAVYYVVTMWSYVVNVAQSPCLLVGGFCVTCT